MIRKNVSFYYFYFVFFANSSYQISNAFRRYTRQNTLAIFGDPNNMIFTIISAVTRLTIMLHLFYKDNETD